MIQLEWDDAKANANFLKHKISSQTAARVFSDPFAWTVQDRIEGCEQRWQTIGLVEGHLILLVAHTQHEAEQGTEIIRIISARKADKTERQHYERNYR